ncbi:MAG: sugar ABC transporter substrate-binding protein [Nitriliruptoraceae bacterium]|nr:sugar ABC transporter substrate-binding protein [Nitriliruptoraceae bacterium]
MRRITTRRRGGTGRLLASALALALVLAACGGDDTPADDADTEPAGEADDDEPDAADEDVDDDGADEGDVDEDDGADDPAVAGPDDVALTDAQIAEIQELGLTFGLNTNNNTDDFSQTIVVGAEAEAEALGIDLIVQNADFDAQLQISQIESLVQQGVDAIFLIAVDADAVSTAVLEANDAGIPVLIVGGPPSRGEVLTVLNAASYDGTRESAGLLAAEIGDGGSAGILGIPLALAVIEDRDRGTADGLTDGGIDIVAEQASFDQEELVGQAESIIQANPDLGGLYATWSLAINAALAAVEQSGQDIKIAGHDAERSGFEAFDAGNEALVALTAQQPFLQGQVGLRALSLGVLGEPVASDLQVPNLLVTPENYRDQWDILYPGITAPWE